MRGSSVHPRNSWEAYLQKVRCKTLPNFATAVGPKSRLCSLPEGTLFDILFASAHVASPDSYSTEFECLPLHNLPFYFELLCGVRAARSCVARIDCLIVSALCDFNMASILFSTPSCEPRA